MVHENSQQGATGGVIWRERKPLGSGVNRVTQVGAIRRSIYMLIRRKKWRYVQSGVIDRFVKMVLEARL